MASAAWLFNASRLACHRQTEYMGLWRAAVRQEKVSGCDSFVQAAHELDGRYHDYILHWHTGSTDGGRNGTEDTSPSGGTGLTGSGGGGYDPPVETYTHADYRYTERVQTQQQFEPQPQSDG